MVVEAREGAVREAVVMKVGETEGAVREAAVREAEMVVSGRGAEASGMMGAVVIVEAKARAAAARAAAKGTVRAVEARAVGPARVAGARAAAEGTASVAAAQAVVRASEGGGGDGSTSISGWSRSLDPPFGQRWLVCSPLASQARAGERAAGMAKAVVWGPGGASVAGVPGVPVAVAAVVPMGVGCGCRRRGGSDGVRSHRGL